MENRTKADEFKGKTPSGLFILCADFFPSHPSVILEGNILLLGKTWDNSALRGSVWYLGSIIPSVPGAAD